MLQLIFVATVAMYLPSLVAFYRGSRFCWFILVANFFVGDSLLAWATLLSAAILTPTYEEMKNSLLMGKGDNITVWNILGR